VSNYKSTGRLTSQKKHYPVVRHNKVVIFVLLQIVSLLLLQSLVCHGWWQSARNDMSSDMNDGSVVQFILLSEW